MRTNIIYLWLSTAIIAGLCGCSTPFLSYRSGGFDRFEKAVSTLQKDPGLYQVVKIPELVVIIAGDRKHFTWDTAREYDSRIQGYARGRIIRVFGYRAGGKIILNEAVLGHELVHVLNWSDPDIADPDRFDELFE